MTYAQITIDARRALLDALVALRPHRDALVLVGAQAIYLYTGDADVEIATTTKDSDIAVVPARLGPDPISTRHSRPPGSFTTSPVNRASGSLRMGFPLSYLFPRVCSLAVVAEGAFRRTASGHLDGYPDWKPPQWTTCQ